MAFLIGLLTLVMVLDCLLLILLVLIQLPKKEAGAGIAFGSSATDALFGAGSGTVLTKITKYAAAVFFLMALVLSLLQNSHHRGSGSKFENQLQKTDQPMLPGSTPGPAATKVPTNAASTTTLTVEGTNLPTSNPPAITTPAPAVPAASNPPGSTPSAPK
jgi:preprotein translocase subunit SecG